MLTTDCAPPPPAASSTPTCPWMASPRPLGPRLCVAMTTACPSPAPRSSSAPPTHRWPPARAVMCVCGDPTEDRRGRDLGGQGPRCSSEGGTGAGSWRWAGVTPGVNAGRLSSGSVRTQSGLLLRAMRPAGLAGRGELGVTRGQGVCGFLGGGPRAAPVSRKHVGLCSRGLGRASDCLSPQMDVQLRVAVPQPGRYALVVEYANEDTRQELGVTVHTPQRAPQQGALTLHPCLYRWAGRAWEGSGPSPPAANRPTPPAAPCAVAPPWMPSSTWPSSTWTQRPASSSQPSGHTSSW